MKFLIVFLVLLTVPMYSLHWSMNHILKLTPLNLSNYENIRDYSLFNIGESFLTPLSESNSWMVSENINVGNKSVLDNAFINMKSRSTDSYVVLKLRNGYDDTVIQSEIFYQSGKLDLPDVFDGNVSIWLETVGTNIEIYSFGLVRKDKIILKDEDILILPDELYYQENSLEINFTLRFPAILDIIIFDRNGKIIETISRKQSFNSGKNIFYWTPVSKELETKEGNELVSGTHLIYFLVKAPRFKTQEFLKKFLFVNR